MDMIWAFKVKVPLGHQWWHAAYHAEQSARAALTKLLPDAEILEAKQTSNDYKLKHGACVQLQNTRPAN